MGTRKRGNKAREDYEVGEKMFSELGGDPIGNPPKAFTGRKREIWSMYQAQAPWLCMADTHAFAIFCTLAAKSEIDYYAMQATEKTLLYDLMSTLGFHPLARAHLATKKKNVMRDKKVVAGVNSTRQIKNPAPSKVNGNGHAKKDVASYFDTASH